MYEKAQHVSARICLSSNSNIPINAGSSSWMYLVAVGGLYGKKDWWLGFWKNFTLFRHKFDIVHEMFCKKGMLGLCLGRVSSFIGAMIPASKTISRRSGPSPAILPKAQTACSTTSGTPQLRRRTNDGTAPCSTTARVWLEWPEAILVKAQAASNRSFRFVSRERRLTKRGRTPA